MLDIRLPMGLYFGLTGLLLLLWGFVGDPADHARSLGVNINLWWGLALVVFGAVMLGLTWLASKSENGAPKAQPPAEGEGPRVAMH